MYIYSVSLLGIDSGTIDKISDLLVLNRILELG